MTNGTLATRGTYLLVLTGALVALLGGTVDRAGAAFPGGNGKIAFASNRDGTS